MELVESSDVAAFQRPTRATRSTSAGAAAEAE